MHEFKLCEMDLTKIREFDKQFEKYEGKFGGEL